MTTKRALVTGITGQDGSYLAEHLIGLGYEVHGTIRTTTSDISATRIGHLVSGDRPAVTLHVTDLGDSHSLMRLIETVEPHEVYNLAAQSHVRASFDQPIHTGDVTGLGAVRLLEAIRYSRPDTRFYQASSSEMFGGAPPPQDESTPFHPRSPYAVAKVYAYWATVNYRESYGIHASNGILFNHECVASNTPVFVRRNGLVDVVAISELVPHHAEPGDRTRYTSDGGGLEIWDGLHWSRCTARTATWHDEEIVAIHGRGAFVEATADHKVFLAGGHRERAAAGVGVGDFLWLAEQPVSSCGTVLTEDEAWLLGLLSARGHVSTEGTGYIECDDEAVLADASECWTRVAAGTYNKVEGRPAGRTGGRAPALELTGNPAYLRMWRTEVYTRDGSKRVPMRVLNAAPQLQLNFLAAYDRTAGPEPRVGRPLLFRTGSSVLAAGLAWLTRTTLGRRFDVRRGFPSGGAEDYGVQVVSRAALDDTSGLPTSPEAVRDVGRRRYRGWMFDLATESGRFAAGVGGMVVHNSPRRGREFVTRKITSTIPKLLTGEQTKLRLGNLEARRDWGHARDYVEAMHLMLQLDEPHDLVVGTGESHSVRDFLEEAFRVVNLDWRRYVEIDPAFYRPAEADYLQSNPAKAEEILRWSPRTSFRALVEEMVRRDCAVHGIDLS